MSYREWDSATFHVNSDYSGSTAGATRAKAQELAQERRRQGASTVKVIRHKRGGGFNEGYYEVKWKWSTRATNARKNPTKAQKRAKAAQSRKRSGIAKAVKGLLKKLNPSAAISGASVVKLKGGALKITPLKANPGWKAPKEGWVVTSQYDRPRRFRTKREADEYARKERRQEVSGWVKIKREKWDL